jgi:hypothetical protein
VFQRESLRWSQSSLSQVEGWHALAGRRTCETLASDPGQADQTGSAGGVAENWVPADRSIPKTTRSGVSRLGGQAGTQAPCPRAHHLKIMEAAPEALPTLSLPTRICLPGRPASAASGRTRRIWLGYGSGPAPCCARNTAASLCVLVSARRGRIGATLLSARADSGLASFAYSGGVLWKTATERGPTVT